MAKALECVQYVFSDVQAHTGKHLIKRWLRFEDDSEIMSADSILFSQKVEEINSTSEDSIFLQSIFFRDIFL